MCVLFGRLFPMSRVKEASRKVCKKVDLIDVDLAGFHHNVLNTRAETIVRIWSYVETAMG